MKFAMNSGLRVVLGVGIAERNKAAPRYSIKYGEGQEGKGDKMSIFLCLQLLFTRSDALYSYIQSVYSMYYSNSNAR